MCATNRDMQKEMNAGRFRQDLYYRLHVVAIRMPLLRERGDDVIAIAEQALATFAQEERRRFRSISDPVRERLAAYHWPGNIRELLNVLRQIVVMNDGEEITLAMLPTFLASPPQVPPADKGPATLQFDALLGKSLAQIERLIIEHTISKQNGSITRAARVLEVAPSTLYRKLDSWSSIRNRD